MVADIVGGETQWADILFLIAAILFGFAGFLASQSRATDSALVRFGLCLVAVGWLLL